MSHETLWKLDTTHTQNSFTPPLSAFLFIPLYISVSQRSFFLLGFLLSSAKRQTGLERQKNPMFSPRVFNQSTAKSADNPCFCTASSPSNVVFLISYNQLGLHQVEVLRCIRLLPTFCIRSSDNVDPINSAKWICFCCWCETDCATKIIM